MKKVTKGVIAVAGFGTRFLPITKAIPKEMLPIAEKPIIQYIAEEMVAAGIKDIILITSWQKRAVEDYFDRAHEIEEQLEKTGKSTVLAELRRIDKLANFIYVRQKGGLGNGAAVLSAQTVVGNEPFLLAFGDDLVKTKPGKPSFSRQLIEEYHRHQGTILGVQNVPATEACRYGIVETDPRTGLVTKIVEKPTPRQTKSTLASFGRYLLTPEIFDFLKQTPPAKGGEIWLVDALAQMLKKYPVRARQIKGGQWYTTGDPINYFKTLLAYSADRPEFKQELKKFVRQL